ncbi:hypothetical protein LINGRAHAP2_LOCUS23551, partial [Linum grandiflorum]
MAFSEDCSSCFKQFNSRIRLDDSRLTGKQVISAKGVVPGTPWREIAWVAHSCWLKKYCSCYPDQVCYK